MHIDRLAREFQQVDCRRDVFLAAETLMTTLAEIPNRAAPLTTHEKTLCKAMSVLLAKIRTGIDQNNLALLDKHVLPPKLHLRLIPKDE